MPELPEVETIRAGLAAKLVGLQITELEVLDTRSIRCDSAAFASSLIGQTITGFSRRGKYLWFHFDTPGVLLAHLGMSGQFRIDGVPDPRHRHTRVEMGFDQPVRLRFVDQRIFGRLGLAQTKAGIPLPISHIARDLLDPDLDIENLAEKISRKSSAIKRVLLDQSVMSGIGNIYADESLWRAGMHFDTAANKFSANEIIQLLQLARAVLLEAIAAGGTSFDSLYVLVSGKSGYFQRSLNAYGRQGQLCFRCDTQIVREPFAGRSSFRCPKCQPVFNSR